MENILHASWLASGQRTSSARPTGTLLLVGQLARLAELEKVKVHHSLEAPTMKQTDPEADAVRR